MEGKEITVTSRKLLTGNLPEAKEGLECIVLIDGKFAAIFSFHDTPREDGESFVCHLMPDHQFTKIMLVSGDRESEVSYLASQMCITEILASQTPEQKLAVVRAQTALAPTLFMGDGINDAPALAAATVGIAVGGGNSVTSFAAIGLLSPVAGAIAQEFIDAAAILWALQLSWQGKVAVDIM